MRSILSCFMHKVRTARAGRQHSLAGLDHHTLRDLGLRRTDLLALGDLYGARMNAACCRARDLALCLLHGRGTGCSC